jgi:hypothetical protein
MLHGQLHTYSDGMEYVCACPPVNILLSHNLQHKLEGTKEKRA